MTRLMFQAASTMVVFFLAALGAGAAAPAGLLRSAEAGGVAGTSLPTNLADRAADTLDFEVTLDTHSGSLSFDMKKVATLTDVGGARVAAIGWTGGKGGHHLSGTLSFPSGKLRDGAPLTLTLKGVGGGKDLVFTWAEGLAATPPGKAVPVEGGSYYDVKPADLAVMLRTKDFFLVNTHVPYEGEIASTDAFIPYDQTLKKLSLYPAAKTARIVLYCRSGRMSDIAARELVKKGYAAIMNLEGGMIAWERAGYPLEKR